MTQLRSHYRKIVVNRSDKFALRSFDDKLLLESGVSSLANGHYKITATSCEIADQRKGRSNFPRCY